MLIDPADRRGAIADRRSKNHRWSSPDRRFVLIADRSPIADFGPIADSPIR
jgi:hypothetical protein